MMRGEKGGGIPINEKDLRKFMIGTKNYLT